MFIFSFFVPLARLHFVDPFQSQGKFEENNNKKKNLFLKHHKLTKMGKADQKRKEKIVEDKTFGLKNKNRSAKVQAYVQQVQQSVKQTHPQDRKAQAEAEARKAAREAKKAREAELALLFKDVNSKPAEKPPQSGEDGEQQEEFHYDPDAYLFRPEDFDEVEHDDRRLEEQLEEQREALKDRTDLTPVTEESFQKWKQQKREEAAAAEEQRLKKAKAGEGKLRGWDLWKINENLFVDDDEAAEDLEREEYDLEDDEEDYDLS